MMYWSFWLSKQRVTTMTNEKSLLITNPSEHPIETSHWDVS